MESVIAIERARLLISQSRFEMAGDLLRSALVNEPNNAYAHSLLAICLSQDRDRLSEATREAQQGVFLAPELAFSHYILATVLESRNQTDQALDAIKQAIVLDPVDADCHGVKSRLLGQKNQWQEALKSAEEGLACDPEDDTCSSLRTIALERLGKLQDARQQAVESLRQNPDSPFAHSSHGWAMLQQGDYKAAQRSFAEALRLSPNNEMARSGMIQALNSANFVFRWFYLAMMKIGRLSSGVQWALILGLWFGMRYLRSLAQQYPALEPWVLPTMLVYMLFVMMSWIMMPLFNMMLRFHPFGKHLLSKKEIWASNLIAGTLAGSVLLGIAVGVSEGEIAAGLLPIMTGIYLLIPIVVPFNCEAVWARTVAIVVGFGFALTFIVLNVSMFFGTMDLMWLFPLYMLGILVYCFVGQALMNAKAKY